MYFTGASSLIKSVFVPVCSCVHKSLCSSVLGPGSQVIFIIPILGATITWLESLFLIKLDIS